ncbi:MAG: cytochrome c4 [Rhodocyclaceae bacterium]|nr:cytochrome c4 [Rhodocyclaceae bacterium]MBK6554190.1 cytochrome c4 [Rhodocyclaceae bacterium]MBK9310527.1 cytochrome c4 [Rhodocyclaceae bacterium]MBK9954402.1 cytochrome c4 [Rhodocyclaceae bacterium]
MNKALWVAAVLALAESTSPAAADRKAASIIEGRCALCHGPEGESASAIYPRLAAQNAEYIGKQLKDFRDGRRKSDAMAEMAADLTDGEIAALAEFFAGKPPKSRRPGDTDLAGVGRYIYVKGNPYSGVPACATCHGPAAHGTTQLPRLAGQHPAYLQTQLKEFNKRARTNDNAVMHTVAAKLAELELVAVTVYLGGLE